MTNDQRLGIAVIVTVVGCAIYLTFDSNWRQPATTIAATSRSEAALPVTTKSPKPRDDAALDAKSTTRLKAEEAKANTMYGEQLMTGGSFENGNCVLEIDGNYYEAASEQDKSLMRKIFLTLCAGSYKSAGRLLPPEGVRTTVYNLAGDQVFYDYAIERNR